MVKASCFDKNGVKKGAWSEDEDNKLKAYIQRYGHWNWGLLPKFAGVARSGKSCRLRWMNYLRPNMKHGNFTKEEDDLVIDLHHKLGNKWSTIASKLPGRSDNEIKNRWNTHLKKRALSNNQTMAENEHIGTLEAADQANTNEKPVEEADVVELDQQDIDSLLAGILSNESSSSSSSSSSRTGVPSYPDCYAGLSDLSPQTFDEELVGNFWPEPLLPNIDSVGDNLLSPFNFVNDFISQPPSCQDVMMSDEFLWSNLDIFVDDDNMEFIN